MAENTLRDSFMQKTFGVLNDLHRYENQKDNYDPLTNVLVQGNVGDIYQEAPIPNTYLFHQLSDQPFPEPLKKSILSSGSYIHRLAHLENELVEKRFLGKIYNLQVTTNHLIPPVYVNIGDCLTGTTNDKLFDLDNAVVGEPIFYRNRITAESSDSYNYGKDYCYALVHVAQCFGDYICSETYPLGLPTNLFNIRSQISKYGSLVPLSFLESNIDIENAKETDLYFSAISDFSHCKSKNFSKEPYFVQFLTSEHTPVDVNDLFDCDFLGISDPVRSFVKNFDIHGVFVKASYRSLAKSLEPFVVHYVRKGCVQDGCDRIYRDIYNFYNMEKLSLKLPLSMFLDLDYAEEGYLQSDEYASEFKIYFVVYRYNIAEIRFIFIKSRRSESYVMRKCLQMFHSLNSAHNQSKLFACIKMNNTRMMDIERRSEQHKNYTNINSPAFMGIKVFGYKGPGVKSEYECKRDSYNVCIDEFFVDIGTKYTFM